MIHIDKGPPPGDTAQKSAELTQHLKKLYAELTSVYQKKISATPRLPVQLEDGDYLDVYEKVWGKKMALAECKKALANVVFGEELLEVLEAGPPVSEAFFRSLIEPWRQRVGRLITAHVELMKTVERGWHDSLPGIDNPDTRGKLLASVRLNYQRFGLAAGRPWTTLLGAREPKWFDRSETDKWDVQGWLAQGNTDGQARCVWIYQKLLAEARAFVFENDAAALAQTLWFNLENDPALKEEDLFAFAVSVYVSRVNKGQMLTLGMTAEEVAQLQTANEDVRKNLAGWVLSARALSEVIDEALTGQRKIRTRPLLGFKSDAFSSAHYSGGGIKEALMNSHFGKCAFCESKVRHIAHGDVEHFRPKAGYEQGSQFNYDGYFWEAYRWENFLFSCLTCNQTYKKNRFPVLLDDKWEEMRSTVERDSSKERPVLINPAEEDPRTMIRFNPLNGQAYPFDLLEWYLTRNGVTPADEKIWWEPQLIPTMGDDGYSVKVEGNSFKIDGKGHELWQAYRDAPLVKMRGVRTIELLGLNRVELRLQRIAHLRGLRALAWTEYVQKAESAAAAAAIVESKKPSAEFSSLAIDAFETWTREVRRSEIAPTSQQRGNLFDVSPRVDAWIAGYNEQLHSLTPKYALASSEGLADDDTLMYLVTPLQLVGGKERGLVYLGQDDELEDVPSGWYIQIPPEDHDLTVEIYSPDGTTLVETTTIKKLLAYSQPWRKMNEYEPDPASTAKKKTRKIARQALVKAGPTGFSQKFSVG